MNVVDLARSYAGCSVSTDRARYIALVGPDESAQVQNYMADPHTSGCALVVRGLWRLAGLRHPRLAPPYHVGAAVADVVAIARELGAWVPMPSVLMPAPGDVVLVGGGADAGGVEHVYTVVDVQPSRFITSIDGGQRDAHGQEAIYERHRTWTPDAHGAVWDHVIVGSDPGAGSRRKVQGFVRAAVLFGVADTDPAPPPSSGARARPTLRKGARGPDVVAWQSVVGVRADGDFGSVTEAATRRWQQMHGLDVDGVVGARSWAVAEGGGP